MAERLQADGHAGEVYDPTFLDRIRQRDPEAFTMLFNNYGKLVLDAAGRYVGPNQKDEISQQVWLGVVRTPDSIRQIDAQRGLAPWFMTSARNAGRDYFRSNEFRRTIVIDPADRDLEGINLFDRTPNHGSVVEDPYAEVDDRFALASLMKTVAVRLNRPDDLTFLLEAIDAGYAAYANKHNQSESAVKSRAARLLSLLRDRLTNEERQEIAEFLGARVPFPPQREARKRGYKKNPQILRVLLDERKS